MSTEIRVPRGCWCPDECGVWTFNARCSRPNGHGGRHAAAWADNNVVLAVWGERPARKPTTPPQPIGPHFGWLMREVASAAAMEFDAIPIRDWSLVWAPWGYRVCETFGTRGAK